jgi:Ca2+-binding RTX toxin-like protein
MPFPASFQTGPELEISMSTINGTSGADNLVGGDGDDTIFGFGDSDSLKGGKGNDNLFGGSGNDVLISGYRDPVMESSQPAWPFGPVISGPSALDGGNDDFMSGEGGNDRLVVTFDCTNVEVDGGSGTDTLQIGLSDAAVEDILDSYPDFFQTDPEHFTAFVNLAAGTGSYRFNGSLLNLDLVIEEIENVDGTAFSETITGTSGANILEGDGGNDTLIGGGGADTLDGGVGRDRAIYDLSAAIDIDLNRTTQIGGEAQGDRLISVEDIDGSRNSDVIRGSAAANELWGNLGNDFLEGRGGADIIDGGAGSDTAAYEFSGNGVTVGLDGSGIFGGDAQGDTLISIENLTGSNFADTLTGTDSANVIRGRNGNDTLRGLGGNDILDGGVGADIIDGGGDTDKVTYADATSGLQIILGISGADGRASLNGGTFERDTLRGIENVEGSGFDDAIFGNELANVMEGGGGSDYFGESRGDDRYIGGSGTGIDTLELAGETAGVTVNLSTGIMTHTGSTERDTMTGIERVNGTAFVDTITGSFQNDILLGGGSGDTINGSNGEDDISGGSGADLLLGGNDGDTLRGGSENDVVAGEDGDDELFGDAGIDVLIGGEDDDILDGGTEDDQLFGDAGGDVLFGQANNDRLDGGVGNDVLQGGAGNDIFVFKFGYGTDTITDFAGGSGVGDQIDLSEFNFTSEISVEAVCEQVGNDTVIHVNAIDTIVLQNFSFQGNFAFNDFLF